MRNLRSANEFAAQRKKRNIWRNVVTCIAAFVVFCTTYALILPAITMEKEDLSCGLEEHAHSSACYQLTCGKQEVYSHTHTRDNCYNSDGALICTLREQTAHHHTQDCYSKPQPACGQVEHAAHTHGDDCYTEGELTCILAETPGHAHSDACYPADFTAQLVCGKQDLPEHRHSDACYIRVCGKEEHAHSDACADSHQAFIENLDQLTPTADDQPTASEAVTQSEATGAEASEAPTETEAATHPETQTEAPTETEATDQEETEAPTQEETEAPTQEADPTEEEPTEEEPTDGPMLLVAAIQVASEGPERMAEVATVTITSKTKDENGNWVDGASYDKNSNSFDMNLSIAFTFNVENDDAGYGHIYTVDADGNKKHHGNEYLLNLKDVPLSEAFPTKWEDAFDSRNNMKSFQYRFEKNENGEVELHVIFYEDYLKIADGQITCYVDKEGRLSADKADSNGDIHYPVDGDVSLDVSGDNIRYEENESLAGDLTVEKTGSYTYDSTSKRLTYTVTVRTTNGTPGPVSIKDVLTKNGVDISKLEGVTVQDRNGSLTQGEGGFTYTRTPGTDTETLEVELPQLEKGNTYTITYVYTLENAPASMTTVQNKAVGTSEKDGKDIRHEAESSVYVPQETPTQPSDSSETTEPVTEPPKVPDLEKTNLYWDENRSQNRTVIPWKITVNGNYGNIAGMKLIDEMLKNRLDEPKMTVLLNWHPYLTEDQFAAHFTIEGDTITFNAVDKDGNPREDGKNENRYEIIFYTSAETLGKWGSDPVSNTAYLGEREVTSTVYDDGGKVEKTTGAITVGADGKYHINWIATVTLAKDGFVLEEYLNDDTQPAGENNSRHYYDQSSVHLFFDGQELNSSAFEVTFFDQKGGNQVAAGQDSTYMQIRLTTDPSGGDTSVAGKQLVLQYTTYARRNEMVGTGNWQNKVDYRNKTAVSYANITPPTLTKLDGKGNSGTTSVENYNGELDWKVNVTLGSVANVTYVKIVDRLPEDVSVIKLSMQAQTPSYGVTMAELTVDANGNITGGDGYYNYSGTCIKEEGNSFYTVRVKATRQNEANVMEPSTTFVMSLSCKVDDAFIKASGTEGTFVNHAEGETNEGSISGSEQTQEWTKLEENPRDGAMSKTRAAKDNTDRVLSYTVNINPKGVDIQPGSSKVYVTDEFTYDPQRGTYDLVYDLVGGSVKLYRAKLEDGVLVKDGELDSSEWRWTTDEDNPGKDFPNSLVTKYIRLEAPDSTPLILEYQYRLTSFKSTVKEVWSVSVKNRAYFTAYPDEVVDDGNTNVSFTELKNNAGSYTGQSLVITKTKEGNSQVLISGAEFQVYRAVKADDGTWSWEGPIALGTDTSPKVYTTNRAGVLVASYEDGFETNVLYKLVETKPADGYIFPDPNNPPSIKFYFSDEDDTEHTLPEDTSFIMQGAKDLATDSDFEGITNVADSAEFSVEKIWRDHNGNNVTDSQSKYTSVSFNLMQIATEVRQDASVSDPLLSTSKVVIGYGRYGITTTKSFTVPKGAVVTIKVQNCTANSDARLWIPIGSNGFNVNYYKVSPESVDGTTRTYSITVKHDIAFGIATNNNDADPIVTYSHTAQSTGNTGTDETTPLVTEPECVGRITLDKSNNWRWLSSEHTEDVPIQGTIDGRTVWFSYYVVEDSGEYTTSYTNVENGVAVGITSGNITVTNTLPPPPEPTAIEIQKQWSGLGELENTEVNFRLIRKQWDHAPTADELQTHEELAYDADLSEYPELLEIGRYILTKDDGWKWSSENVVTLDSYYNGKWYTYFIIEEPGNYSVTYSKEISSGTLTVVNTTERKPTSIEVDKQWFDYFGKDVTQDRQGKISFELHRVTKVGEEKVENSDVVIGPYDVSQTSNPAWKWSSEKEKDLILYSEEMIALTEGAEKVKVTYTYYVVELVDENATEKFTVEYKYGDGEFVESDTTGISSGSIIIKNTLESPKYELPKTGGTGTLAYTLAGLLLTLTSALALTQKRRKGVS